MALWINGLKWIIFNLNSFNTYLMDDDDDDDDDLPPLKSARHGHSTIFVCGGIIPIIEL